MKDVGMDRDGAARPRAQERKSQSRHAPSFPFYWRDWLSSPEVQALDDAGQGKLMRVLCYMQGTDRPGIATEEQVRIWTRCSPEEWVLRRDGFKACFRVRADGLWIQERARREHLAQKRRYLRARKAGKEAAQKLWRDRRLTGSPITQDGAKHPLTPYPRSSTSNPVPDSTVPGDGQARPGDLAVVGAAPVGELLGTVMGRLATGERG